MTTTVPRPLNLVFIDVVQAAFCLGMSQETRCSISESSAKKRGKLSKYRTLIQIKGITFVFETSMLARISSPGKTLQENAWASTFTPLKDSFPQMNENNPMSSTAIRKTVRFIRWKYAQIMQRAARMIIPVRLAKALLDSLRSLFFKAFFPLPEERVQIRLLT